MTKLCESCKRLIKLYGTNEFAVPWRCQCSALTDDELVTVQHTLSPVPEKHDPFAKWRDRFQYWMAFLRRSQE